MSLVGTFPGLALGKKRTIPSLKNPYDKSTVVSIYPKGFYSVKSTIQPGKFNILPGTLKEPSLLVVGSSSWWREIDEDQPLVEIPVGSMQVAASIVRDFCNGLYACDMQIKMPGIFWVPGEFTSADELRKAKFTEPLNTTGQTLIAQAHQKQVNYYKELVELTDSLWSRTNGNPLVVPEDARIAARELQLVDRVWMKDHTTLGKINCKACGSLINPDYPVCGNCKAIWDADKAKKLEIQFAK